MIGNVVSRTGPGAEPISLLEAKTHCSIDADITYDDTLIATLIAAARAHVEKETSSVMITRGLRSTFPHFAHHRFNGRYTLDSPAYGDPYSRHITDYTHKAMRLRGPVRTVESIAYLDEDKVSQILATSVYDVDASESSGAITLAYGQIWPITYIHPAAVSVNFISGYATPFSANTTGDVITAVGHPYVDGDIVHVYNSGGALPAPLAVNTNYFAVGASGDTLQLSLTSGGAAIDLTTAGTGISFLGVVPEGIRQAMLLLIGHWYLHRESAGDFHYYKIPDAVDMLLDSNRIMGF